MPTIFIHGLPTIFRSREMRSRIRSSLKRAISQIAALNVLEEQVTVRFGAEESPDENDPVAFYCNDVWFSAARAGEEVTKTMASSIGAILNQILLEWGPKDLAKRLQVEGQVCFIGANLGDAIYPTGAKPNDEGGD